MLDLRAEEITLVRSILQEYAPGISVWAFGSRVRGTAKKTSDLDLVLLTDMPMDLARYGNLKNAFAESDLPFRVDLIDWATTSAKFRTLIKNDHIDLTGRQLRNLSPKVSERRIGVSGFAYAAWKGKFYPQKLPAKGMLAYYAERFLSVEINGTFYRMPQAEMLEGWLSQVPANFVFAFKAPGSITHRRWNSSTEEQVRAFIEITGVLGKQCGPLLFQFPPTLKKDSSLLEKLIALIPKDRLSAWEFRHTSWFSEDIYALLKNARGALVYNDADTQDVPFLSMAPWGYLRLRKTEYTDQELRDLLRRCEEQSWKQVFIFFKHEDKATAPALAERLTSLTQDLG